MSIKLPPLPKPDINTASHIGQRIVGYTEKTVDRLCREAIEADRAERQGEAVALIQLSDLNELMHANGMSVWMENPLIHPPHCEGDAPVGFVSVYLAPAPKPAPATQQAPAQRPLTDEQIQDLLGIGNPTEEECRLIRLGWEAANGIGGEKP